MAGTEELRHRPTPERALGDELIVARPRDGGPIVLERTAAVIWRQLDEWTTVEAIDRKLWEVFPEVASHERVAARIQVVTMLGDQDLVERR